MPTPSKFTADRIEEGYRAKRLGASDTTAARCMGVDPKTLRDWLAKGENAPEGSRYRKFYEDWHAAATIPNVRALEIVQAAFMDKPELAWKFLERREPGFAPLAPSAPVVKTGPVLIQLGFADSQARSDIGEGTVIDVAEVSTGTRRLPRRSA